MELCTIGQWQVRAADNGTSLLLIVSNSDNSNIHDTDSDIGADGEVGLRLTSKTIEDTYTQSGEISLEQDRQDDVIQLGYWNVDIVVDEDNHLNLYVGSSAQEDMVSVEHTDEAPYMALSILPV
jgi:hypothetical protein